MAIALNSLASARSWMFRNSEAGPRILYRVTYRHQVWSQQYLWQQITVPDPALSPVKVTTQMKVTVDG